MARRVVAALLILASIAQADPSPNSERTEADFGMESTSDDNHLQVLQVRLRHRPFDLSYPYRGEKERSEGFGVLAALHNGSTSGFDFRGAKLEGSYARKINPNFGYEAALGGHELWREKRDAHHIWTGRAELGWTRLAEDYLSLGLQRDYLYPLLFLPGGATEARSSFQAKGAWTRYWAAHLRSAVKTQSWWIDDGNSRGDYDLSFTYGARYPVWWWVGIGAEYLHTRRHEPDYWSPLRFLSYGLRSEIARTISGEWQMVGGLNIHRLKEDDYSEGQGYYFSGGVNHGSRDQCQWGLRYERILSEQRNQRWTMEGLWLSWQRSF